MSEEIKRMTAKEFRELGLLQEVNRLFLHRIGLALEVKNVDTDQECFGDVWDYRDDPEGMLFEEERMKSSEAHRKAEYVKKLMAEKVGHRYDTGECELQTGIQFLIDENGQKTL